MDSRWNVGGVLSFQKVPEEYQKFFGLRPVDPGRLSHATARGWKGPCVQGAVLLVIRQVEFVLILSKKSSPEPYLD